MRPKTSIKIIEIYMYNLKSDAILTSDDEHHFNFNHSLRLNLLHKKKY